MTKAKVSSNGTIEWTPPAIYKSMCQINIEWQDLITVTRNVIKNKKFVQVSIRYPRMRHEIWQLDIRWL